MSGRAFAGAVLLCGTAALHAQAPATDVALGSDRSQVLAAQLPVARLSRVSGAVTVQAEDGTNVPMDAALNMPLPAGERLSTGENGEAEVEFTDGSVARVTSRSDLGIERIDAESHATSLQLGEGLFYLELRASDRGSYTVAAGEVVIQPEQNVSARVRVKDGQVEVAVLVGSLSVTRANAYTATLQAGETMRTDPKNRGRYLLQDGVSPDPWDSWNERLAQAAREEGSARTTVRDGYAGGEAYGWADLDSNGTWYSVPGEGDVWQPTLADAGFDPYGSGAWVYGPGGYAWASGYAWGWLPYRCGAWSYYQGFGWGWLPSSGCLNFGFGGRNRDGWNGVRHPPTGWHPPQRPVSVSELGQRHPTIPVAGTPLQVGGAILANRGKSSGPVRVGGVLATVVGRVGRQAVLQNGSAVGSAFQRDFPVRAGTHEPVLGLSSPGPVSLPGGPVGVRPGPVGRSVGQQGWTDGRVPLPTDPPLGAAGAPPLGATGAPPFGANGPAPLSVGGAGRKVPGSTGLQPRVPVVTPTVSRPVVVQRTVPLPAPAPVPRYAPPAPAPVAAPRAAPAPSAPATVQTARPR